MTVSSAAAYREITLSPDPAVVLERVHELSASGPVHSWVAVRCYQLEHAERLAGELVGLVLEVQLRRRGGEPI
ncbi:MAG: hypothetical protein M3513_12120, partial [Actinomycetota bacterium]|nr:hypothetical protein [Actinomycetota bacterium]